MLNMLNIVSFSSFLEAHSAISLRYSSIRSSITYLSDLIVDAARSPMSTTPVRATLSSPWWTKMPLRPP